MFFLPVLSVGHDQSLWRSWATTSGEEPLGTAVTWLFGASPRALVVLGPKKDNLRFEVGDVSYHVIISSFFWEIMLGWGLGGVESGGKTSA